MIKYKDTPKLIMFLLIYSSLSAQAYIVPDLKRDDFKTLKTWWIYQNHGGQIDPVSKNGYLYAILTDPVGNGPLLPGTNNQGMNNVGIMTADQRPIYGKDDYMIATIRIKTLNVLHPGTRGWGFWKSEGVPVSTNQAVWFMEQTAQPDSSWSADETWWRARTHRTVSLLYDLHVNLDGSGGSPFNIDNQQWHTYKVIRNGRNYYEHYVDNVLTQHITPSDFPDGKIMNQDYSFNCWNDNLVYHHTTNAYSGNDTIEVASQTWTGQSEFVVDFIEIKKGTFVQNISVSPVGSIALREVVNEIDDGITDGNFKGPYSFNAVAGKTVIIASGKAEELDTYAPDDDMKLIVDSKDYKYNSTQSWNGLVDSGTLKTIVIDTSLSAGNHTLEFQSIFTPILYDATVLSSANGSIALNQTIDASAASGSINTLWQTFNFNANAGDVVIYVSGSADEEPGWNHQSASIDGADDDELRMELDGYDFGWGTDSASFVGNTLFGDNKTICVRKTVSQGSHTLKMYANQTPYVHKVIVYAENGDIPLPVSLTAFYASLENGRQVIRWQVASELKNAGFNLYRAFASPTKAIKYDSFSKINDHIIPGRGNASGSKTYSFVDDFNPPTGKVVWYRLEDVAYDGTVKSYGPVQLSANNVPDHFEVSQNYPNPFNPITNIAFSLPIATRVNAQIYDIRGRNIRTLTIKVFLAGKHVLVWDGLDNNRSPLPSGIYYCRIQTNQNSEIRKMTLLR